jgi:hypothetical protein
MDPVMLGSIIFLAVCLCFMVVLKVYSATSKTKYLPPQVSSTDSNTATQYRGAPLPMFDPEPRKDTILAAGRYHWKMKIVYYSLDGSVKSATCAAPKTSGIPRHKITSMTLVTPDGNNVPLHRIRSIEVQAASEETRERYRVRDAISDSVIKTWREAIELAIETNREVTITYQDEHCEVSVRRIQPIKLLSVNSRPKLRAHCHLAKAERHFMLERMLDLQVEPPKPAMEEVMNLSALSHSTSALLYPDTDTQQTVPSATHSDAAP